MQAVVGKRYQHYKNRQEYIVRAIGRHSETLEELVIYEAQYTDPEFGENAVWARPRELFESMVENEAGEVVPRFQELDTRSTRTG